VRKIAARLSPCKIDKPEGRKFNRGRACRVQLSYAYFKQSYRLEGTPWRLEGDFWAHEYSLNDNERQVMRLSKKWFTWGDSYELDIADPNDEVICLCVALAVDCVLDAQKRANNSHPSNHR
jgi:uncharacterized protein YxjI